MKIIKIILALFLMLMSTVLYGRVDLEIGFDLHVPIYRRHHHHQHHYWRDWCDRHPWRCYHEDRYRRWRQYRDWREYEAFERRRRWERRHWHGTTGD